MSRGAALPVQLHFNPLAGRLGRKPYWAAAGLLIGVRAIASAAGLEGGGWILFYDLDDILVAFLISRRMRDFGWSPLWAWLGMAIMQIAPLVAVLTATPAPSGAAGIFSDFPPATQNLTQVLLYILVGLAGLAKGNSGPNRYGPPPGGGSPMGERQTAIEDEDTSGVDAIIARSLAARSAAVRTETNPGAAIAALARGSSSAGPPAFGKRR
jgi:uncharacterized membrane protein YhaH (DUF805 family)